MGRVTTQIAAIATDADNLGSVESLPKISFIDALLPRSFTELGASKKERKPLDPNIGRKHTITYYDIKKDSPGRKSIVAHRSSSRRSQGGAKPAAEGEKKGYNGGKGTDNEKPANGNGGSGGGDDKAWAPEEDAELRKCKEANKTWKEIASEMKRSQAALKARWKEIGGNANAGGDAGKAEEKKGDDGKKTNDGGEKKAGDGKKGGGGGQKEFTTDDDAQLKKLKGEGKEWREIAKEMKRGQKQLQTRWEELGGDAANAPANENPKDRKEDNSKQKRDKTASPAKPSGKAASKARSIASSRSNRGEEARFTLAEWDALQQNNGLFSIGELQLLSELIMNDQNHTWGRIASRFYDKTGRRVHPEDVRECFERFAAVG